MALLTRMEIKCTTNIYISTYKHIMLDNIYEMIKKPFYLILIFLIYISYFIVYFGIFYVNPEYTVYLSNMLKIFICFFLIIRFHPFRKHHLLEFDDKLIFGSGLILLSDLGVTSYLQSLLNKHKNIIMISV